MKTILLALLASVSVLSAALDPTEPDAKLTPGDVLTTDVAVISKVGYTKTVRNVPISVKQKVFAEYGIPWEKRGDYEVDHLISLELGGSNDIKNLWPESYSTKPNARDKDVLENKLHDMVVKKQITLEEAQKGIARDWIGLYLRFVGKIELGRTRRFILQQGNQ